MRSPRAARRHRLRRGTRGRRTTGGSVRRRLRAKASAAPGLSSRWSRRAPCGRMRGPPYRETAGARNGSRGSGEERRLVGAEAVEVAPLDEVVLVEDVMEDAQIEHPLADGLRRAHGKPTALHDPRHRLVAHEGARIAPGEVRALLDGEP